MKFQRFVSHYLEIKQHCPYAWAKTIMITTRAKNPQTSVIYLALTQVVTAPARYWHGTDTVMARHLHGSHVNARQSARQWHSHHVSHTRNFEQGSNMARYGMRNKFSISYLALQSWIVAGLQFWPYLTDIVSDLHVRYWFSIRRLPRILGTGEWYNWNDTT